MNYIEEDNARCREFRLRLDRFEKAILGYPDNVDDIIGKRKQDLLEIFSGLSYEHFKICSLLEKANKRIEKLETDALAIELRPFDE